MNKSYLPWVDLTRIIAVFLVTLTHSALPVVYNYDNLPRAQWLAGNLYNSLTRACVPLFFMLSGYLLLSKNEKLKDFLFTRIPRILIPLAVWSAFYVMWNAYYEKSAPLTIQSVYQTLFNPAYYHLWFLYALAGNYLYIPILKVFMDNSTRQIQYYFIALWFLAVSIPDLVEETTGSTSAIDLKMISGYVGYLVIGTLIGNMKITRKHLAYSMLVIPVCLGITFFGTCLASVWRGTYISYFYHNLSPNVIVLSAASFIFIKGITERSVILQNRVYGNFFNALASLTLGIYLIHRNYSA